jgi:hypothetical protein
MIVTRQNHIPFSWLLMVMVPWILFYFMIQVNGLNFFILNRLIENPVTLTLILSLPGLLFTIIPLGAYISFMSDRIWTRWGRRKIFLIINFTGQAMVLFFYPLAPSIWAFVALMFLGSLIGTFGYPFEALKLEIVPPDMRGRSGAINQWVNTIINIVFWGVVLGRFDEVMPLLGRQINGVTLLFWAASGGLLIVVFNYLFGIHEVQPKSTITGEKFDFKKVWHALTMPQLRYLYVFIVATAMLNAGLGVFSQLLYINQWGYSLQEMGFNVAVGGTLNLFIIPLVGVFADRGQNHRMTVWIVCLLMVKILTLGAFAYYTWYLPDQRPSLVEIIFFGESACIFSILAGMVYYPLVYDYVPRNLMGTYIAGAGIVGSVVNFLTSVGIGGFMWGWATLFQPPAGDMVQVCLDRSMKRPQVEQMLRAAGLRTPEGKPAVARDITARPWYANGIVVDSGTCYEARLHDADSEARRKERDDLKHKCEVLRAKIKQARKAGKPEQLIASLERKWKPVHERDTLLDSVLLDRAEQWQQEVVRGLGACVMKAGSEVLAEKPLTAVVAELPVTRKAPAKVIDRLNKELQAADPSLVDLTIVRHGHNFALAVSALEPVGTSPDSAMRPLCRRIESLAAKAAPGLVAAGVLPTPAVARSAVSLDLALVENPVRTFVSLITVCVNAVLTKFTEVPPPDQKIIALGRNVCKGDTISHARVTPLQGRNGVRIIAVVGNDSMGSIEEWMPGALAKIRTEAASLKLTVPKLVVDKGVKPIKYNYLAGNIYMFILVLFGFLLVLYFLSKERKGIVKKWGAEEAHLERKQAREQRAAAEAAAANPTPSENAPDAVETYTPGYLVPKIVGALLGLALVGIGVHESWPNIRLLVAGTKTQAVAAAIVATKPGQPDIIMPNQAEVIAKMKAVGDARDYTWTFYDQFTFETTDGSEVSFRRMVGCKMKPTIPLMDDYGLPTTAPMYYDPRDPSKTVLPLEYSTWLVSILVAVIGLIFFLLSGTLALFARKPIVLSSSDAINLT